MMNEARIFEYTLQIQERHLDTFGHVNNATYLQIYEEARWDFITANGFGLERIRRELMGPVILEANVKFKRELINRENITIRSQTRSLEVGRVMLIDQQMMKADGKAASEAIFTIGFMDLRARKLVTPPPDWLKACGWAKT